jgi:hypothetical protein
MFDVVERESKWVFTYQPEQLERQRRLGNVTQNGVVFYDEPTSWRGNGFYLFVTDDTTKNQIRVAKSWLRNRRDVTGFELVYPAEGGETDEA